MAEDFSVEGMLDMYLFENRQLLEKLQETVLDQKDADCFDEDAINEIFRTMHTIKGSSGIMMFDEITEVSHKLEDIFYFIRESDIRQAFDDALQRARTKIITKKNTKLKSSVFIINIKRSTIYT